LSASRIVISISSISRPFSDRELDRGCIHIGFELVDRRRLGAHHRAQRGFHGGQGVFIDAVEFVLVADAGLGAASIGLSLRYWLQTRNVGDANRSELMA